MRVDDNIKKTVVFLGDAHGKPFSPHGTGFIVTQTVDGGFGYESIVTAKHVIEGIRSSVVHARINTQSGEAVIVSLPKDQWFFHPDSRVDAAVFPSLLGTDRFDYLRIPIGPASPNISLNEETVQRFRVGVGDDVCIAGMFVGILGEQQNIPIVRTGTIAAMKSEPIATQYGYHDAFLIEVRSIDGLSGSPVFVHLPPERTMPGTLVAPDPNASPDRGAQYLMGLILGYNEVLNPTDNILVPGRAFKVDRRRRKVLAPMNTGIAVVLPIEKVIETLNQPEIAKMREEAERQEKTSGQRRFVPTSAASAEMGEPDVNPSHREDFTSLLSFPSLTFILNWRSF